jgi:hypothetical protein
MRRRTLLVALVGLAVVGAAGVVVLWPRTERVTRENFDRIRKGMTRQEVEALLGPPEVYSTGPTTTDGPAVHRFFDVGDTPHGSVWETDTAIVQVTLAGSVMYAEYHPLARQEQGPFDNLLWRAKRQWHCWFPE